MNIDPQIIVQGVSVIVIAGLIKDHIAIRSRMATFITQDAMRKIESEISHRFNEVSTELRKIAEDLAFLRGKSGG